MVQKRSIVLAEITGLANIASPIDCTLLERERKSFMTEKVFNYRKSHPKCDYCVHLKFVSPSTKIPFLSAPDYFNCTAKKKIIHGIRFSRYLCKCYEVENK